GALDGRDDRVDDGTAGPLLADRPLDRPRGLGHVVEVRAVDVGTIRPFDEDHVPVLLGNTRGREDVQRLNPGTLELETDQSLATGAREAEAAERVGRNRTRLPRQRAEPVLLSLVGLQSIASSLDVSGHILPGECLDEVDRQSGTGDGLPLEVEDA